MSLGAIWAAAGAGLGVTVRTRAGMPKHLSLRDDLPQLPAIGLVLYRAKAEPAQAVQALFEIVREISNELLAKSAF